MKTIVLLAVPALLSVSCSTSDFKGNSKSSNKAADLTLSAGNTPDATTANPNGAGTGGEDATGSGNITGNGGTQSIPGAKVCPPALPNTKATAADPSGVGATYSSDNTGTQPCTADSTIDTTKALIGNPAKTVVVGGIPGASSVLTTKQQDALTSCMKLWGFHSPFLPTRTRPDKIIFGNLEIGPANRLVDAVLGTEFSGITDEEVTTKPSLILILATVNLAATHFILPEVTYKFHNPKGWYCIDFGLNIASSTKIELKKGAQLADSRFDLSILSSSPASAAHQVSILSHTDIVTIP